VPGPLSSQVVPSTGTPYGAQRACDNQGRPFDLTHVVVNFANVGSTYGVRVLKRDNSKKKQTLMDYEGVRRCLQHLTASCGLKIIGVVYENFRAENEFGKAVWDPPNDVTAMCESIELTPRVTGSQHKSADDEMTIKCAYRRNCRFLDNDNYADWLQKMPNETIRQWLEKYQEFLQMRFYFDTNGTFDTLDGNVSVSELAVRVGTQSQPAWRTTSST